MIEKPYVAVRCRTDPHDESYTPTKHSLMGIPSTRTQSNDTTDAESEEPKP